MELKKINPDYVLMFVGDGELRDTIKKQAQSLGVYDSIVFTGIRNDIPNLLQAMDLFVFPSFNEGLGIALIEAQASGLPCIANKDGIIPLAKISELVKFISLSDGSKEWARQINNTREKQPIRKDMSSVVKKAGFDIMEVTKWLEKFYTTSIIN